MSEALTFAGALVAFLAFYLYLQRRAGQAGAPRPVSWTWLAAVLGLALAAFLVGVLLR